jgi:SAM-dependent methyltransferase
MASPDPTDRFTDRVDDYVRYRPAYPAAVIDLLRAEIGLDPSWFVADLGSGTGISCEPFLGHGNAVFAVEPNEAMRSAAEARLARRPGFRSVAGTAERTGLRDGSVDLVVAAQAFHWFAPDAARREASRILRGPKWAALHWNTRHTKGAPFLEAYEALLDRFGTDYERVRHDKRTGGIDAFFTQGHLRRAIPNAQALDWPALRGRVLSSSYTPGADDPAREGMVRDLRTLFETHATSGTVTITYDTEIFIGRL